ncbi:hypothetical protein [Hymenobacter segetis]|uniref:Polynucleotide kinase-phosphatase ligase domain-containing protein n=1 Tax=Hymenobacter segetis TaxID=2025509 RepID=A0ABU9LS28_9BACT
MNRKPTSPSPTRPCIGRGHGTFGLPNFYTALKCRGRECLRIIYGPDYLLPGHLDRLRQRNVKAKSNLALREFALGVEGELASWPASPCAAYISESSACYRWKTRRWTHGCRTQIIRKALNLEINSQNHTQLHPSS